MDGAVGKPGNCQAFCKSLASGDLMLDTLAVYKCSPSTFFLTRAERKIYLIAVTYKKKYVVEEFHNGKAINLVPQVFLNSSPKKFES